MHVQSLFLCLKSCIIAQIAIKKQSRSNQEEIKKQSRSNQEEIKKKSRENQEQGHTTQQARTIPNNVSGVSCFLE